MPLAPKLLEVKVNEARAWFDGAKCAVKYLSERLYREFHASMLKLAEEVGSALPKVDSFISDENLIWR